MIAIRVVTNRCIIMAVFFLLANAGHAQSDSAHRQQAFDLAAEKAQRQQLVVIRADDVKMAESLPIAELTLATVEAGRLQAIPFQLDQMNVEGFAFVPEMGIAASGHAEKWDGRDELVFRLQDVSQERLTQDTQLCKGATPDCLVLAEIEITQAQGLGYVYLVQGPMQRSLVDYVRYDADTYFAETEDYTLAARLDNPFELLDLTYRDQKSAAVSLLDTLKMWIIGHGIGGLTEMTITNQNVRATVVDVQDGPVRAHVLMKMNFAVAKIPIMDLWAIYQFGPSQLRAISRAKTPQWMPMFVHKTSVGLSIDANDLRGSSVYTHLGESNVGFVDGQLSREEVRLQQEGFSDNAFWWLLVSPDNFQVLARLQIPKEYKTPVQMIYQDDLLLTVPPERFIGQLPNIGFQVSNIPLGVVYTMQFDVFFDNAHPSSEIHKYVDTLLQPVAYNWHWLPVTEVNDE